MEEFKMNLLDDNDEVIRPQEIENEEVVEHL